MLTLQLKCRSRFAGQTVAKQLLLSDVPDLFKIIFTEPVTTKTIWTVNRT